MPPIWKGGITDVPGVKVGHFSDLENGTGVTALIFEKGAAGGLDARGMASGSRELLALDPLHVTARCHGLCLAGGSAFGLGAADGVMKYLAEREIGYFARVAVVPIVPAAIIFDLSFINHEIRPDSEYGYRAAAAAVDGEFGRGCVGAGAGATVGKLFGIDNAMKSGVGTSSVKTRGGATVGALAAVNNLGDVIDPKSGEVIAGTRKPGTDELAGTAAIISDMEGELGIPFNQNTNLIAVATDAALDKAGATKLARMSSVGMARTLSPAHSTFDGDMVFAFSTGDKSADVNQLGVLGAECVAEAIIDAVLSAVPMGGLPSAADLNR